MNKKIIWGIVIVIILIVGGFAYNYLSKPKLACWPYCPGMTDQDREEIKKSSLETETASWKTYTNQKESYGFSYPSSYHKLSNDVFINYDSSVYKDGNPKGVNISIGKSVLGYPKYDLSTEIGIEEYASLLGKQTNDGHINSTKIRKIFSSPFKYQQDVKSKEGDFSIYYAFPKFNNNTYYIVYVWGGQNDQVNVNKILSTFKFTEPAIPTFSTVKINSKIYKNTALGFQLTLPNTWVLPTTIDKYPRFYSKAECSYYDPTILKGDLLCESIIVKYGTGYSEGPDVLFSEFKAEGLNPIMLSSFIPGAIVIKIDYPEDGYWHHEYDIFFQSAKRNFVLVTTSDNLEKDVISSFKLVN